MEYFLHESEKFFPRILGNKDNQDLYLHVLSRFSCYRTKKDTIPDPEKNFQYPRKNVVPLSWEDSIELAANELIRVKNDFGNEAIFGGSYGWASAGRFHHSQSQLHRFLNSIGGYVSSYASYSTGAAQAIIPHVLGLNFHKVTWGEINSWKLIEKHTCLLYTSPSPRDLSPSRMPSSA